jgi:hypothetical protein
MGSARLFGLGHRDALHCPGGTFRASGHIWIRTTSDTSSRSARQRRGPRSCRSSRPWTCS